MDVYQLAGRRMQVPIALMVIVAIVAIGVAAVASLRSTQQSVVAHEADSTSTSIRATASAPGLVSGAEVRFLVARGATQAELAAKNERRWIRLQERMVVDPWAMGLLRHRPGMTMADLTDAYLSRR